MYVDKNTMMASAQDAYTTAAAYIYGSYSYDCGTTGRYGDVGKGKPVAVIFTVDTDFESAGSATVTFQIRADVDLTIDTNSVVIVQTGAIAIASLPAGKVIVLPIPAGILGSTYDHLGVSFLTGTAETTAGAVTAFIGFDW